MELIRFSLLAALLSSPLAAQEKPADPPPAQVPVKVLSATVILRHTGQNIPVRFTSYISQPGNDATFPLLSPETDGWIATFDLGDLDTPKARFYLEIEDTKHLHPAATESSPALVRPVLILSVSLPFQLGTEIPIYRSRELSIAVLLEPWSE